MSGVPPRLVRLVALLLAGTVLATACGGGDDGAASENEATANTEESTTTSRPAKSTTTTTTTTTTLPPRPLEEDELWAVLLQPGDVPEGYTHETSTENNNYVTDPPECGEGLTGVEAEVELASYFFDPNTYVIYDSFIDYTPGLINDDIGQFRDAIAGPCSVEFGSFLEEFPARYRFEALPDPGIGDDSIAMRIHISAVAEGYQVNAQIHAVVARREDVTFQMQILTGDLPEIGNFAPEIGFDEVLRLTRLIDQRLADLLASR